jgi:ABC-type Fe3+-hydroxamate transport system substrate-binding protein
LLPDQLGRTVALPHFPPRRIVSLVPSQTELLHDLGLEEEVAGITKFCVHPSHWFQTKPRVGGTKTLHLGKIDALRPDLIIGNKEENERGQIEALTGRYPVWLSDVLTLGDALDMIERVGVLTGRAGAATALTGAISVSFLRRRPSPGWRPLRAAYLIWRKPYMVAAAHTFIDAMLRDAGFINVFSHRERYPEVGPAELAAANPEVVLLSTEPYPFAEKHFPALHEACPEARLRLVDGEMFSWYGSRLLKAPGYFQSLRQSLGQVRD